MASVFTFDPSPPRLSSPWSTPPVMTPSLEAEGTGYTIGGLKAPPPVSLAEYGITKLEAEPQLGPTEYKLHLLLRPRRSFTSSSTGRWVSGSHQSRSKAPRMEPDVATRPAPSSPIPNPSFQSRQNRLQHLTTQLLWRLQQSSPYHSSSAADLVLPVLPETALKLGASPKPGKLLPGLEESRGALYEIGVSDDGSFIGLAKDELDESLLNLRAMAASLGCKVEVLRIVVVGNCEWLSTFGTTENFSNQAHKDKLLVAEVRVLPDIHQPQLDPIDSTLLASLENLSLFPSQGEGIREGKGPPTEQLRVSIVGSTTAGKSSLLGILSTSILDNGRGKARLSLLRHPHEIATGVTSSVAPELIGYHTNAVSGVGDLYETTIVNYACANISSWNEIHNAAEGGRLVFFTDSAGHSRYRRTTVRSLISWAPHWAICCIASDDYEDSTGQLGSTASALDIIGPAGARSGPSEAHLDLCLKLELPLVVVFTKSDLASIERLRQTLRRVLSVIKAAGRQPVMLIPQMQPGPNPDLHTVQQIYEEEVKQKLAPYGNQTTTFVPILVTSAVTGNGINQLHALLNHLEVPKTLEASPFKSSNQRNVEGLPQKLFHVDEIFTRSAHRTDIASSETRLGKETTYILSGHLRYGHLCLGDEMYIGPFTLAPSTETSRTEMHRARSYPGHLSENLPATLQQIRKRPLSGDYAGIDLNSGGYSTSHQHWRRVHVTSLRNLRLPVQKLFAGQVGTVGVEFSNPRFIVSSELRKGMVLAQPLDGQSHVTLGASGALRAVFDDKDYLSMEPGQVYNIYAASIRASAKIVTVEVATTPNSLNGDITSSSVDDVFGFETSVGDGDDIKFTEGTSSCKLIEVTFQFLTYREWIEVGTKVLVMPGSTAEGSVGFVGRITQALE